MSFDPSHPLPSLHASDIPAGWLKCLLLFHTTPPTALPSLRLSSPRTLTACGAATCCPPAHCRLDFCETLLGAATAYGIDGCWQWKPLLDGKQVSSHSRWCGGESVRLEAKQKQERLDRAIGDLLYQSSRQWGRHIGTSCDSQPVYYSPDPTPSLCMPLSHPNPRQVMAAVGMKSGGPQLGKLMAAAADWQLANPQGTAEECREWLQRLQGGGADAKA